LWKGENSKDMKTNTLFSVSDVLNEQNLTKSEINFNQKEFDLDQNSKIKSTTNGLVALIILIVFQTLDGFFTYHGVSRFGPDAEANPLIKNLIINYGIFHGITSAKLFTIFTILFLWNLRNKVKWVVKSLNFLSIYYLLFALIPWTILFAQTL